MEACPFGWVKLFPTYEAIVSILIYLIDFPKYSTWWKCETEIQTFLKIH